jgi:hypothetical protein
MAGWEKVPPTSTEDEPEPEYEEVSQDLSEPEPEARPQLNQQNRGNKMSSEREQLIEELKQHGIDVAAGKQVDDDVLTHLAQHCRSGYVNKARSEYRTGFAQHRLRVKKSGTPAPQQTVDLSYPTTPPEGKTMSNNLDPDIRFRLENFLPRTLGIDACGMTQQQVVELSMQAAVGRHREYAEAISGQEIIDNRYASQDDMRAWLDNNVG